MMNVILNETQSPTIRVDYLDKNEHMIVAKATEWDEGAVLVWSGDSCSWLNIPSFSLEGKFSSIAEAITYVKELWTAGEGDVKAYEICNDEVEWTEAIKDMF